MLKDKIEKNILEALTKALANGELGELKDLPNVIPVDLPKTQIMVIGQLA